MARLLVAADRPVSSEGSPAGRLTCANQLAIARAYFPSVWRP